ncbi:MAG TPA: hypothetical protein VF365_09020 [Candidatus Limnocylindria bacterium]
MNWRAIGCGGLALAAFVLVAVFAILRAGAPAECPATLPYEPAPYQPVGSPTDAPLLVGIDEPLEPAGSITFGLATWDVWVEPGRRPAASGEPLPQRIVLACGDESFQAYQRGTG